MDPLSRRNFIKTAGLGTAGAVLGLHGLSAGAATLAGPSAGTAPKGSKIRMAAIGIANRGAQIVKEFDKTGLCEFVALCDVDPKSEGSQKTIADHPKAKFFQEGRLGKIRVEWGIKKSVILH